MTRTLAARIALLSVVLVTLTVVVSGVVAAELVRQTSTASARRQLGDLADAAETRADRGDQRATLLRVRRLLRTLDVDVGVLNARGRFVTSSPAVVGAVRDADTAALAQGRQVSAVRRVDGAVVFVEGRPTLAGGVVLVQPRRQALAQGDQSVRRMLLALLVGLLVAVPASVLLARALARPLRRTASAARSLADGRRDVRVPVEGPVEVAEVADSLNALASALDRSESQQRAFLMSVSHDLRTPLTAIRGYAESMADGALDDGDTRQVGRVLTGEATRLERLVADLLDLARLEADAFRVDLAPTDLDEVVAAAARAWGQRCARAGVELRLETAPVGVTRTDASRVRQVLDGLLENAVRITPGGAPLVVASRVESGTAVLEVRDGGPGLTPQDVEDAFRPGVLHERYRSVRPSGTGLGLAIAAGLVARLGGTLEAGTAPEGGARFTVRLPRVPAPR